MNDLTALLDRAAHAADATGTTGAVPIDVRPDLARGHRALARSRGRRAAVGLLGVAAAGVAGVGVARLAQPDPTTMQATDHRTSTTDQGNRISFLAQPMEAGPYTFASTPEGWEVQGVSPSSVTIAPVGFADQDPSSFEGKLAIFFHDNPLTGEQVERDGRTFWIHHSGGYTMVDTRTLPGEPTGTVQIQFPDDTGWDQDTMLAFLGSVTVGAGAQIGVG